jgi:hypothetical protein
VIDASVVACARSHDHAVVTSDAKNLRRLDPLLSLVEVEMVNPEGSGERQRIVRRGHQRIRDLGLSVEDVDEWPISREGLAAAPG